MFACKLAYNIKGYVDNIFKIIFVIIAIFNLQTILTTLLMNQKINNCLLFTPHFYFNTTHFTSRTLNFILIQTMAQLAQREARFRVLEERYNDVNQILKNLEKELRSSVKRQKKWKAKIMVQIVVSTLKQNMDRQQRLFQSLERINRVTMFVSI